MKTARADLQATFRLQQQEDGLQDMKFSLGKVSESTVEEVCAVVNRVIEAVDSGRARVVKTWGDSHKVA